jgi:hypothetical protein
VNFVPYPLGLLTGFVTDDGAYLRGIAHMSLKCVLGPLR